MIVIDRLGSGHTEEVADCLGHRNETAERSDTVDAEETADCLGCRERSSINQRL